MQPRARLIYNPTSGNEGMGKYAADILDVMESAGYEASAYRTTPAPLSARDEAARVSKAGFDLVVAAGGDGTINEVVNGIAPCKHRPRMGIIPAGTTNDYARALHIPREDPVAAAKVIARGQTLRMDIGKANDKYFMNIAGGGSLTELTYGVPSEFKSIFGYLAYLIKGAEMLPAMKNVPMHIKFDDGEYDGQASMFLIGLTNSIGGFEQIVPDAELGDGKFTMIVVKTANLGEILKLIAMVFNGGKHVDDDNIIYAKTAKIEATRTDGEPLKINLDGEYGGDTPMTFLNLSRHIEMFANVDDIPDANIAPQNQLSQEELMNEVERISEQDLNGDGTIGGSDDEFK